MSKRAIYLAIILIIQVIGFLNIMKEGADVRNPDAHYLRSMSDKYVQGEDKERFVHEITMAHISVRSAQLSNGMSLVLAMVTGVLAVWALLSVDYKPKKLAPADGSVTPKPA